jgi:hypothetical protein
MAANPPELAHQRIIESDPMTIDCWINYWRPVTNLADALLAVMVADSDSLKTGTLVGIWVA